jgi:hypothetical protein
MSKDHFRRAVSDVYERLAAGALRREDVVTSVRLGNATPRRFIRHFARSKAVYEDDARILSRFRREMGAILDIGAHWGYMALSFRHAGTDCAIVSFEPMRAHHACLDELRRIDGNFDFSKEGLGESEQRVTLYGPVVNGKAIMGLNSVDGRIFDEHHREHLVSLVGSEIPAAETYEFKLLATPLVTRPLDKVLAARRLFVLPPFRADTKRIAAMKLDVEGHEPHVLRGAEATLRRDRPFIMIESGNRNPAVRGILKGHGYVYAERAGDRLVETTAFTEAANGFWLHAERRSEYQRIGLL